ncbi:MAG: hypothetical protein LAO23_12100 [Acidobacteriia bacterium]|nr:hypothetical protein [Terriglobia bacterium]
MNLAAVRFASAVLMGVVCVTGGSETAHGNLPWPVPKKEAMRLRLVALAWNHPRSSFSTSEEIFIAEKELTKDETTLVKLVYEFLPYEPRLSDEGLDYSTLHEMRAVRDPQCDETLGKIASGQMGDWRQQQSQLKYSPDAPPLNPSRHTRPLPCYVTNAEDYTRPVHDQSESQELALPTLKPRP